jgi:hypothetical protein
MRGGLFYQGAAALALLASAPMTAVAGEEPVDDVFVRVRDHTTAAAAGVSTTAAAAVTATTSSAAATAAAAMARTRASLSAGGARSRRYGARARYGADTPAVPQDTKVSGDPAQPSVLRMTGAENVFTFNATHNATCIDFAARFVGAVNANGTANNGTLTVRLGAASAGLPVTTGASVRALDMRELLDGRVPTDPVSPTGVPLGVPAGAAYLTFALDTDAPATLDAELMVYVEQLACDSPSRASCPSTEVDIVANPQPGEVTELHVPAGTSAAGTWQTYQFYTAQEDTCLDFVATAAGLPLGGKLHVDMCASSECPSLGACDAETGGDSMALRFVIDASAGDAHHARTPTALPVGYNYLGVSTTGGAGDDHAALDLRIEQIPCNSNGTVTCPATFQYIEDASAGSPTIIALDDLTDSDPRVFSFNPIHPQTCIDYAVYVRPAAPLSAELTVNVCASTVCPDKGCEYAGFSLNAGYSGMSKSDLTVTSVTKGEAGIGYFAIRTYSAAEPGTNTDGEAFLFVSQYNCGAPSPTPVPSVTPSGSPSASPSASASASPSASPSPSHTPAPPACEGAKVETRISDSFVSIFNGTVAEAAKTHVFEFPAVDQATCVLLRASITGTGDGALTGVTLHGCLADECPEAGAGRGCAATERNSIRVTSSSSGPAMLHLDTAPVNYGKYAYLTIAGTGAVGHGHVVIEAQEYTCAPKCPGAKITHIPHDGSPGVPLAVPIDGDKWAAWSFMASEEDTCVSFAAAFDPAAPQLASSGSSGSGNDDSSAPAAPAPVAPAPVVPTAPVSKVGLQCRSTASLVPDFCVGLTPNRVCAETDIAETLRALTPEAYRAYKGAVATRCGTDEYRFAMCPNDPSAAPPCAADAGSVRDFCASGFSECSAQGECALRCYSACHPCHDAKTCDALVGILFAAPSDTACTA